MGGPDVAIEDVGHLGPSLLDQGGRGREVAVLARRVAAAAEDDHLDAGRQRRQLAHEARVHGDEERGERGLGRAARRLGVVVQRAAEQDVDAIASSGQGAADRDVVDDAAVDQHVAVDRHRREDGRDGRGGQDGLDGGPVGDPALAPVGERGRHDLDRDHRVLEVLELDPGLDDPAQPGVGVHGGALEEPGPRAVERPAREDVGAPDPAPHLGHVLDALGCRVARVGRAVDRTDGRAEDPVGADAAPDELFEHADLHGAAAAAARQHERRALRGHDVPPRSGAPPLTPARAEALAPGVLGPADVGVAVVVAGVVARPAEAAHGSDRGGRWRARSVVGGGVAAGPRRRGPLTPWRLLALLAPGRRRPTMSWRTAHTMMITTSTTRATTKSPNTTTKAAFVAGPGRTRAGAMHSPG